MQQGNGGRPDAVVSSPDKSVQIMASTDGRVEVGVQALNRHTEQSLARQVRAAARVALATLQKLASADGAGQKDSSDRRRPW
ncbi:hypothetical protein [Krasilnikovia sp. MM14-A1259]|uniref:hypothetical protein n=1 Tax=Krasilnikovia sp. MM14-A1259 TaxID=3373539 RepID=UPI003809C023